MTRSAEPHRSESRDPRSDPEIENVLSKSVPIHRTDASTFDDSFSFLKEKFAAEMRKVDEEMTKFSADLRTIYEHGGNIASAQASSSWDAITSSPLIQTEGNSKMLKLQYDLSQFDAGEVKVQINEDTLVVDAYHQEQSDNRTIVRQFKRNFLLPRGTDPNTVISSLSRDGVLTVQIPLPQFELSATDARAPKLSVTDAKAPKTQKAATDLKALPRSAQEAKNPVSPAGQVPQSPMSSASPVAPNLQPQSPETDAPIKKVTSKTHKK